MKYLKNFEELELSYKIGEYVVIDPDSLENKKQLIINDWLPNNPIGKIVNRGLNNQETDYNYAIKYPNGLISHIHDILRLATPEEIEKYNIMINANKYNL